MVPGRDDMALSRCRIGIILQHAVALPRLPRLPGVPMPLPALRLVIALLIAVPGSAAALDAEQTAAIDRLASTPVPGKTVPQAMASHYAVLLWVEDYCNGQSDEAVRKYVMSKGASDEQQFEAGWLEAMGMLGAADKAAMCELALAQYGPGGALIQRAWRPKAPAGR